MTEKKNVWAVTRELEIVEKASIVEDGKVLVVKNVNDADSCYAAREHNVLHYSLTEDEAKKWAADKEKEIRDMVPKVRRFIQQADTTYMVTMRHLGIKEEDYLERHADTSRRCLVESYEHEHSYAKKLETFITSRMLDIAGYMLPFDQVRNVKWYGYENSNEYEPDEWKALLTDKSGNQYATATPEDVRLLWAVIGKASGSWFHGEDIEYIKDCDE